jgi:hypothetical protein
MADRTDIRTCGLKTEAMEILQPGGWRYEWRSTLSGKSMSIAQIARQSAIAGSLVDAHSTNVVWTSSRNLGELVVVIPGGAKAPKCQLSGNHDIWSRAF